MNKASKKGIARNCNEQTIHKQKSWKGWRVERFDPVPNRIWLDRNLFDSHSCVWWVFLVHLLHSSSSKFYHHFPSKHVEPRGMKSNLLQQVIPLLHFWTSRRFNIPLNKNVTVLQGFGGLPQIIVIAKISNFGVTCLIKSPHERCDALDASVLCHWATATATHQSYLNETMMSREFNGLNIPNL